MHIVLLWILNGLLWSIGVAAHDFATLVLVVGVVVFARWEIAAHGEAFDGALPELMS